MKRDKTCMIVNVSNSDQPVTHWLQFAQDGVQFFLQIFLDKEYPIIPMPFFYKYMRYSIYEGNQILMNKPIQSANLVLCGLFCIYVAHVIISSKFSKSFKVSDHDVFC